MLHNLLKIESIFKFKITISIMKSDEQNYYNQISITPEKKQIPTNIMTRKLRQIILQIYNG